jgi:ribose 5-phosphate isomerase B
VIDVGAATYDSDDDYPTFCIEAARRTVADEGSLGVVIGGSGNGEQIAANKVPGCRAALAWSTETASLARQHTEIVDTFLATRFSGDERHARRIALLTEYERSGIPPALPS